MTELSFQQELALAVGEFESLDPLTMLRRFTEKAAKECSLKICSVFQLDSKRHRLKLLATQAVSSFYLNKGEVDLDQSLSGEAIFARQPIRVNDVRTHPKYAYPEMARIEVLTSFISIPLFFQERPLGVVNAYPKDLSLWTHKQEQSLRFWAFLCTLLVANIDLTESKNALERSYETRKLVDQAKRILIKQMNITEDEAHRLIQITSMQKNKPQIDIAKSVILRHDL